MNRIFPVVRYAAIMAVALLTFACRTAKPTADSQTYTEETKQTATGSFTLQTVAETVPEWKDDHQRKTDYQQRKLIHLVADNTENGQRQAGFHFHPPYSRH